jgi:fructokinase
MLIKNIVQHQLDVPICMGSGLVALDVIYEKAKNNPKFLAGGSCGNVLTILSYFGWNSYPVARLGNDQEGNRIMEDMKRWNVKTDFVELDSKMILLG